MQFQGAVIKEQGVTFAIAVVRKAVLDQPSERDRALLAFRQLFRMPVILMAQGSHGVPYYYGQQDIVRFLQAVPLEAVPWRRYSIRDL